MNDFGNNCIYIVPRLIHIFKSNHILENDARFTKLCRMLGKTMPYKKTEGVQDNTVKNLANYNADIDAILNITGVDKASKLVSGITLEQMVKVLKNLALKKRRSTPLLNSLSINISGKEERLNLKQCSDVLFAVATLNFTERSLIAKICDDIQVSLKEMEIKRSSIIGSTLKSLAILKIRDIAVLDCLAEWIINNETLCRTQDVASLILSLAALNYVPIELESTIKEKIIPSLTPMDFKSSIDYLTFVWSLMALNVNSEAAYNHVLQDDFIEKLKFDFCNDMSPSSKLKLLNINAGVKLLPNYKGAMLDRTKHKEIYDSQIIYNHEKQLLVKAMVDALRSLVPGDHLQTNVDSSMGFTIGEILNLIYYSLQNTNEEYFLDAQFYIDNNGNIAAPNNQDCKR